MVKIYLYIKESPLGLKYLGKTIQNPQKYMGSGKRWLRHIKKHKLKSEDIKTTILFETFDREELRQSGIYFSDFYDVVINEEWANLKPENGDGGGGKKSEEEKNKISQTMKKRKLVWSDDAIEKRNKNLKGRKMPPHTEETKKKLSEMFKGKIRGVKTKETYKKAIETKKKNGYKITEETKLKIKNTLLGRKRPNDVVEKLGKKIEIDGVIYLSMSQAERILNKTRYIIKKEHKIL
jgi:hypothetical protein